MLITHLPADGYRRMPWRNGAGTTTEIAVSPAGSGLDEFEWRLAIADLDRSGPFSSFPGVDRLLMVLPPGEVTLIIDGGTVRMPPLEVVRFAGEWEVSAVLGAGPARDLNLMLRRGGIDAVMAAFRLEGERRVALDGSLSALCAIDGDAQIELGGESVWLRASDTALVEPTGRESEMVLRSGEPAVLAQISFSPPETA